MDGLSLSRPAGTSQYKAPNQLKQPNLYPSQRRMPNTHRQPSMPNLDAEYSTNAEEATLLTPVNSGKVSMTSLRRAAGPVVEPPSQDKQQSEYKPLASFSILTYAANTECPAFTYDRLCPSWPDWMPKIW